MSRIESLSGKRGWGRLSIAVLGEFVGARIKKILSTSKFKIFYY
jgi:hypothetical protein